MREYDHHVGAWARFRINLHARFARKTLVQGIQHKFRFGEGPVTLRQLMGEAPPKPSIYQRFLNLFR